MVVRAGSDGGSACWRPRIGCLVDREMLYKLDFYPDLEPLVLDLA